MRTTQQMSITLPKTMSDLIKQKVAEGEYASESEVVREGMRALMARDKAVDQWLQQQILPVYDAIKNNPNRRISAEQVRVRLDSVHQHSTKKA